MPVGGAKMEKRIGPLRLLRAFQQVLLISAIASLIGQGLRAEEIRIRVLNAHNGKPVPDECVNVFTKENVSSTLVPTDKEGVATLLVEGDRAGPIEVAHGRACNGAVALHPTVGHADTIQISGDYYVACQEYGKTIPGERIQPPPFDQRMPSYSVARILQSGIVAANTCGKIRVQAKPGELILFVRPRSLLEKLLI